MKALLALIMVLTVAACAGPTREETAPGIPASDLGLAPGELAADPAPDAYNELSAEPGEIPPGPRAYSGAPPTVPHSVEDFLPVTRTDNLCLECHMTEEKVEGEATPVPPSHYIDLRNSPGTAGSEITGARWNCTACHAPRSDAEPLVENRFNARNPVQ